MLLEDEDEELPGMMHPGLQLALARVMLSQLIADRKLFFFFLLLALFLLLFLLAVLLFLLILGDLVIANIFSSVQSRSWLRTHENLRLLLHVPTNRQCLYYLRNSNQNGSEAPPAKARSSDLTAVLIMKDLAGSPSSGGSGITLRLELLLPELTYDPQTLST